MRLTTASICLKLDADLKHKFEASMLGQLHKEKPPFRVPLVRAHLAKIDRLGLFIVHYELVDLLFD